MAIQGIGTHIVECLRIARLIERYGELFIERVYGAEEIDLCRSAKAAMQQYAGVWAGKVAVLEALGIANIGGVRPRDVEIAGFSQGRYQVELRGPARDAVPDLPSLTIHLTISPSRTHAVAFAVVESDDR